MSRGCAFSAGRVYAAPLAIALASLAALAAALLWGDSGLALYFAFWIVASLSLAFVEWKPLYVILHLLSAAAAAAVVASPVNVVFKASVVAMTVLQAYMLAVRFSGRV